MGKQDPNCKLLSSSCIPKLQEISITLKVFIHCEGCRRKVKRIIKCVDGVKSVTFDTGNGKVIVLGSGVDTKAVLESLHKAGKHAEMWPAAAAGGGKLPNNNNNNNNNNNANKNKLKNVAIEKLLEDSNLIPKGKALNNEGNTQEAQEPKLKSLANMKELVIPPEFGPPPMPSFPNGAAFTPGIPLEKPNNIAILSKNVAPRPAIYHGETSYGNTLDNSEEYATVEYATHLFSDENANNCTVM